MYQVLARKWRPQRFEELIGQQHVARTLSNAVETDRLAHAYIFAGLRGTGKTSAARILAKCLNCEGGPTTSPCGECAPCREIAGSEAIDVLEIDAASRTKVEQTRELLEVVSYAPARDRYKILIIDEAHMLSKASFNALLKTLEEPPPNVLFVLATTEIQKILPTILSRCQVFEFHRVSSKDTAAHLRKLCDEEKIEISDTSLERIARAGEGSVRDALSLLERVLAFCGEAVGDEDVLGVLGAVRTETLIEMVGCLGARDAAAMLGVLDGIVEEGHDLVHFWGELIGAVRDLMLLRTVPERADLLARSAEEAAALGQAAADLSLEDLTRIFQILAELEPLLKSSSEPRYLFEATLVRLAGLGAVRPIEEVLAGLSPGPGSPPADGPRARGGGSTPRRGAGGRSSSSGSGRRGPRAEHPSPPPTPPAAGAGEIREAIRRAKPMLAAILDEATEFRLDSGTLVIAFPPGRESLRRQVERTEYRAVLDRCAAEVAGDVRILITNAAAVTARADMPAVGEPTPSRAERPATPSAEASRHARAPRGTSAPKRERPDADRRRLLERATAEPGVQKLMLEFGAQVVDIQPLEEPRDAEAAAGTDNAEEIP